MKASFQRQMAMTNAESRSESLDRLCLAEDARSGSQLSDNSECGRPSFACEESPKQRGRRRVYTAEEIKRRRRIRDRLRRGYSLEEALDDRRKKCGPKGPRLSPEERRAREKKARREAWKKAVSDPRKREAMRAYMRRYWRKRRGLPEHCVLKIGRPSKLSPGQMHEIMSAYSQLRSWGSVAAQLGVCRDTLRKFLVANQRALEKADWQSQGKSNGQSVDLARGG
jgi:DNA-binding transcriptional MerR regulator